MCGAIEENGFNEQGRPVRCTVGDENLATKQEQHLPIFHEYAYVCVLGFRSAGRFTTETG